MKLDLLVADDDIELCDLLCDYFSQEDIRVTTVHNGQQALEALSKADYDILILDVMMPIKNGFDTLAEVRQRYTIPVIMLTARGEKIDRIVGLEMGADDYVAKPCDPRELLARVRAVVRRTNHGTSPQNESQSLDIDGVSLDKTNRQVILCDQAVECTSTEFEILALLMDKAGSLVTKEQLSEVCLGKKLQTFDRSIDMHLSNLRRKIGDFEKNKPRIKTIRGSGYQYLIWSDK